MNFLFKLTFIYAERPKFISLSIIDQSAINGEMQKIKERNWHVYQNILLKGRGVIRTGKFRTVYRALKTPGNVPPMNFIDSIMKAEITYREPIGSMGVHEMDRPTRRVYDR